MPVTVQIPVALRAYADNKDSIELAGATVAQVVGTLGQNYPKLKPHLFNDKGALRNFVNVYLNDEDIRYLKRTDTPVTDGDVLTIVPAVAGG